MGLKYNHESPPETEAEGDSTTGERQGVGNLGRDRGERRPLCCFEDRRRVTGDAVLEAEKARRPTPVGLWPCGLLGPSSVGLGLDPRPPDEDMKRAWL